MYTLTSTMGQMNHTTHSANTIKLADKASFEIEPKKLTWS